MNTPNKLTMLRMIIVPFMVLFFYIESPVCFAIGTGLFIIGAITDFLDGHIARKYELVTDFGKFLDPIADKLLVVTAMVLIMSREMIVYPYIAEISLIIVIAREFAISGLRMIAAGNGTVIAADKLGKIKTATQTVAIPMLMTAYTIFAFVYKNAQIGIQSSNAIMIAIQIITYAGTAIYIISTLICIVSGVQYLVKNKEAFMLSK